MSAREKALEAHKALLNGSGKLPYFRGRGIDAETVKRSWVGYDTARGAFAYPSIAKSGGLLGIHYKSEGRNAKGKRAHWWEGYADDLPPKGHGKKPDEPAKIVPFGMETLEGLTSGSPVVLCCGEEDALSLRQAGYVAVSQPGAGLLEPVYAKEFADLDVVVFYDAGEENEARRDASKLCEAGVQSVRVVEWPPEASNGADINGRLVESPESFEEWVERRLREAEPLGTGSSEVDADRKGVPDAYTAPASEPNAWPVLSEEALYGLPGDIVRAIEPHTEADPVALLANLLAAFGNTAGRGFYVLVEDIPHHPKLNAVLVGETSKGRKGTSWGRLKPFMHAVDPVWAENNVTNGLSSGEGLINAVRDPVMRETKNGEETVEDEGVSDKRLLVVEGEFARVMKMASREGNTLSPVIREAWDDGTLRTLTKNSPLKATSAHISIIGHITKPELLRHLSETEAANGFANRFLWLMVKRSKLLPFGGGVLADTDGLVRCLKGALEFGKSAGEIGWGESAKEIWEEVYGPLSDGKPGLFGAVVGRAEAQAIRLASIYAVMDQSRTIEEGHLLAALALWQYAEDSARYIFGDATGDAVADRIMQALRANLGGLTRTQIRNVFGRNQSAERIEQALTLLLRAGLVRKTEEKTGGRPSERWFAT